MDYSKVITLLEALIDELPLTTMKRAEAKAWLGKIHQSLSKMNEVQKQVDELKQKIEELKDNGKDNGTD